MMKVQPQGRSKYATGKAFNKKFSHLTMNQYGKRAMNRKDIHVPLASCWHFVWQFDNLVPVKTIFHWSVCLTYLMIKINLRLITKCLYEWTRKPRKGAAVIAASMHGFASCRKFKSPVTLTLTLDRVKVKSTYTLHVGLPAGPTTWL